MRRLLTLACVILATACRDDPADVEFDDHEGVAIAFFSELFEAAPGSGAAAYCISTGTWENRVDPTEAVVSELRIFFPRVQPASLCVSDPQGTTYNGEPARSFHIDAIMVAGESAVAQGFYRQTAADVGSYRAQLQKQLGRWVVIGLEMV